MKIKIIQLLAFFVIALVGTSCVTNQQMLDRAARDLEQIEESQNYSGKIAVSDVVFLANKGEFSTFRTHR